MADKTPDANDTAAAPGSRDWSKTLFLPKTDFPMRAGLPKREPEWIKRWQDMNLHDKLRADSAERPPFVLHDGPPYANGNLHIGHALNKILKDIIVRSQQMMGKNSHYVPGWDCHGLPIEWKIEEKYRAKGRDKDAVPINEFRKECREFAEHWVGVQREEFQRLGVEGDWYKPYLTMSFHAEAVIANELMKFAMNGSLYRGSKPVMWSVVERTALAEAEVEYHDYQSDMVWVKFPVVGDLNDKSLTNASVVIWTTTPWTIPANRAISYSPRIAYGLYEVTSVAELPDGKTPWAAVGEKLIVADALAADVAQNAKIDEWTRVADVDDATLSAMTCAHPLRGAGFDGYQFDVPLLAGDHVTDDTGTGFVHTAPGHGADDFEIWMEKKAEIAERGIPTDIPFCVGADGKYTAEAPGFEGEFVITHKGEKGKANRKVMDALREAGNLLATGRLKHQYPHSWRSKKPVIFRNTPQWFVGMDTPISTVGNAEEKTLREMALAAIDDTRFVPTAGQNRLRSMIEQRPDWVLSRQRAWGVPITVFVHNETAEVIPSASWNRSADLISRITEAFEAEGADAWFAEGAKTRFLEGLVDNPDDWEQVTDILDVWFDSGSTHAFTLEDRPEMTWPASVYLEGSDQHRGWFHSSLLESCGTRGRAPYDCVITHGFTMDEQGRKMSKSLGNTVAPQDVIKQNGADILRLWVASTDYADDQRIGPEIIKSNVDAYRKLRNTFRFLLGNLAHYDEALRVAPSDMPELERLMLHRLAELDDLVRSSYDAFDFKRIFQALFNFATVELSAFYFDIRKDALYCEAPDSVVRRASLTVLDEVFSCLTAWMAPLLAFTTEEVWLERFPGDESSVHLRQFPDVPDEWRDAELAAKWADIRTVRRVVTGALEVERRAKTIGSSLDAAPVVHVTDAKLAAAIADVDMAEVSITSGIRIETSDGPADAFRLDDTPGVAVVFARASGKLCARSRRYTDDVGADPDFPDLSARDAAAVRAIDALSAAAPAQS